MRREERERERELSQAPLTRRFRGPEKGQTQSCKSVSTLVAGDAHEAGRWPLSFQWPSSVGSRSLERCGLLGHPLFRAAGGNWRHQPPKEG